MPRAGEDRWHLDMFPACKRVSSLGLAARPHCRSCFSAEGAAAAGAIGDELIEQGDRNPLLLRACAFRSVRGRCRCRPPPYGLPAPRSRGRRRRYGIRWHDRRIGEVARLNAGELFLVELARSVSGQLRCLAAMMRGLRMVDAVLWRHRRHAVLGLRLTRGVRRQSGATRIGARQAHRVPAGRTGWLCPGGR